jgi:hypothetical protein
MAERFVEVDRDTPMLLPADLRAWVPEDDLVHFVLEAVGTLPTGEFVQKGRARYLRRQASLEPVFGII